MQPEAVSLLLSDSALSGGFDFLQFLLYVVSPFASFPFLSLISSARVFTVFLYNFSSEFGKYTVKKFLLDSTGELVSV